MLVKAGRISRTLTTTQRTMIGPRTRGTVNSRNTETKSRTSYSCSEPVLRDTTAGPTGPLERLSWVKGSGEGENIWEIGGGAKCTYLTTVISKAEIEKQISIRTNSNERYYNKWKPLIDKEFVT